jgi:hypothetical protein
MQGDADAASNGLGLEVVAVKHPNVSCGNRDAGAVLGVRLSPQRLQAILIGADDPPYVALWGPRGARDVEDRVRVLVHGQHCPEIERPHRISCGSSGDTAGSPARSIGEVTLQAFRDRCPRLGSADTISRAASGVASRTQDATD